MIEQISDEFQVNITTSGFQRYPAITSLSNGSFVVGWQSFEPNQNQEIVIRIFGNFDPALEKEIQVTPNWGNNNIDVGIEDLSNDRFLVTWTAAGEDGSGFGVFGQIFDYNGNKIGQEFLINTETENSQSFASVELLSDGSFVVVWTSSLQDGSGDGVFGQRFSRDGMKINAEFQANTYFIYDQNYSDVTQISSNQYVIAWKSEGGLQDGIYAQIFSFSGDKIGSEFLISEFTTNAIWGPSISSLSEGGFVVTWTAVGPLGWTEGYNIYARVYDEFGSPITDEFLVNNQTEGGQVRPDVSGLESGGFIITWTWGSGYPDIEDGIYAQLFDKNAIPVNNQFQINDFYLYEQEEPAVSAISEDSFTIVWQSRWQDGSEFGVFGKTFLITPNDAPTGSVTITGTSAEGNELTAITSTIADADGLGVFSYQWLRDGTPITGANSSTYTLSDDDIGNPISVRITYTDGWGTTETLTSAQTDAVTNVNDAPTGSVTITGTPAEGNQLTAITSTIADADGLGAFSYQWLRDGAPITGANSSTYTLSDDDIGDRISVRITYTDGGGTTETLTSAQTAAVTNANDDPTGAVTITGTASEGNELTAITSTIADADGLGAFSYQWLRDGAPITGANSSTYTLSDDDIGDRISVRITYTDGGGTTETLTSAQTAAVTAIVPETIVLTDTSDIYTGTDLPEIISTRGGDDLVIASKGNDTIDGGDGTDRVSYDGDQDAYTVTLGPSGVQVRDRRADGNGTDTLTNIEFLEFDTGDFANFNLEQFGGATSLNEADFKGFIELYIAYFNRAPDAIGLNFWGTAYANGTTMEQMAELFAPQDETLNTYPEGTSNTDFATAVYNNVLGRTPDQAGFDFWVGVLDAGAVTRDQFILEVLRGVQDGSPDRDYLDNKVDVGAYFAVHKGMSDTANAAAAMQLYDGTEASIQTVKQAIDAYHLDALDPINGEFLMPLVGVLDDPLV